MGVFQTFFDNSGRLERQRGAHIRRLAQARPAVQDLDQLGVLLVFTQKRLQGLQGIVIVGFMLKSPPQKRDALLPFPQLVIGHTGHFNQKRRWGGRGPMLQLLLGNLEKVAPALVFPEQAGQGLEGSRFAGLLVQQETPSFGRPLLVAHDRVQ